MPLPYKLITAAMAMAGCASLVLAGQADPIFLLPSSLILIGYYRYLKGSRQAPKAVVNGFSLLILAVLMPDVLFISGDAIVAIGHFTLLFQAVKSFDLNDTVDPLQVFFMSLLQLVIASELSQSIFIGAVFGVFLFTLVSALLYTHLMRMGTVERGAYRRALIVITACVLCITVALFITIPRVPHGLFGKKKQKAVKTVGFTDKVDLGSFGEVLSDDTVVMRVELSGPAIPLYWRGITHDFFDGASWRSTTRGTDMILPVDGVFEIIPYAMVSPTIQKIVSEPMDTDVMFGLGRIGRVVSEGRLLQKDTAEGIHMSEKARRRLSYTVYSTDDAMPVRFDRGRFMQLPAGMERVEELAMRVTANAASSAQKARAIEEYLKANYRYSLVTTAPKPGLSPLEDFLFESRRGYCEHYATAMAIMLRTVGVQTRIVSGFHGGQVNMFGNYTIVRQSDAHSWVEAVVDKRWQRFDPTPQTQQAASIGLMLDSLKMAWYSYVVDYNITNQIAIFKRITLPVTSLPSLVGMGGGGWIKGVISLALVVSGAVVIVIVALRAIRTRRLSASSRMYLSFRARVKKHGGQADEYSTPDEVLQEAIRMGFDARAAGEFIRIYEQARFGAGDERELRKFYKLLGHPNSPIKGTNTLGT